VQIFLTFAENNPVAQAPEAAENLRRDGSDSMPTGVQKAGRKLRHAMRDLEPFAVSRSWRLQLRTALHVREQRRLLNAANNLDELVYPLFLELDQLNEKTAEIEELRRQLKIVERREEDIGQLRRSLAETKAENEVARNMIQTARDVVVKERAENARLSCTVQRQLSELNTKEEENALLRAKLTKRDNRVRACPFAVEPVLNALSLYQISSDKKLNIRLLSELNTTEEQNALLRTKLNKRDNRARAYYPFFLKPFLNSSSLCQLSIDMKLKIQELS
jgi:hypothetical protein